MSRFLIHGIFFVLVLVLVACAPAGDGAHRAAGKGQGSRVSSSAVDRIERLLTRIRSDFTREQIRSYSRQYREQAVRTALSGLRHKGGFSAGELERYARGLRQIYMLSGNGEKNSGNK